MKDEKLPLRNILDSIERIQEYLQGKSLKDLEKEQMLYDAVLMQFVVIGEQVNHVDDVFRERHSEIPWVDIAGMRNQIAHGYFDVDLKTIWDAYKQDFPILKKHIKRLLDE